MYAAALAEAKASLAAQGQKMPAPGSTGYQAVRTNVVNLLVQQAELGLQAKKLGLTVSDAATEKKLDRDQEEVLRRERQALPRRA